MVRFVFGIPEYYNDHPSSNMSRVIEFPVFREEEPVQWFAEMEDLFKKFGVTTDSGKCAAVAAAVARTGTITPDGVTKKVPAASPATSPYEILKSMLLWRWAGGNNPRRPSELLADLSDLKPDLPDSELRAQWLRKLPCRVRFVLDACAGMSSVRTAALADRIVDLVNEATAEGASRSTVGVLQRDNSATNLSVQHVMKLENSIKLLQTQIEDMASTLRETEKDNERSCEQEYTTDSDTEFLETESEGVSELCEVVLDTDLCFALPGSVSISNAERKKFDAALKEMNKNSLKTGSGISSKSPSVFPVGSIVSPELPSAFGGLKKVGNNSHTPKPDSLATSNRLEKNSENFSGTETRDTGIDSSQSEPISQIHSVSSIILCHDLTSNDVSGNRTASSTASQATSSTESVTTSYTESESEQERSPSDEPKATVLLTNDAENSPVVKEPKSLSEQETKNKKISLGAEGTNFAHDSSKLSNSKSVGPSNSTGKSAFCADTADLESLKKTIEEVMKNMMDNMNKEKQTELMKNLMETMNKEKEAAKHKKKPVAFVCYYHARFGRDSYRCRSPCEFNELSSEDL